MGPRARAAGAGIRREAGPGARRRGGGAEGGGLDEEAAAVFRADLAKVHRGCFYTLWHADGREVQHKMSKALSSVIKSLGKYRILAAAAEGDGGANIGFEYCRSMMLVLRREWFGIDRLRLDKFMLFARMMVLDSLRAASCVDGGVALFTGVVRECVIGFERGPPEEPRAKGRGKRGKRQRRRRGGGEDPGDGMDLDLHRLNDAAGSVGLTMHVASVLLPCLAIMKKNILKGSLGDGAEDVTASPPLFEILLPFLEALGGADVSAAAFGRIVESIVEPIIDNVEGAVARVERRNSRILRDGTGAEGDDGGPPDAEAMLVLEKAELRRASDVLLLIAGSAGTREDGRGVLYDLQMRYQAASAAVEGMARPLAAVFPGPAAGPHARPAAGRGRGAGPENAAADANGEEGSSQKKEKKEKKKKKKKVVKVLRRPELAEDAAGGGAAPSAGDAERQRGKSRKRKAASLRADGDRAAAAAEQPAIAMAAARPAARADVESPARKRVRFALKRNMTKLFDKTAKNAFTPPPPPSPMKLTSIIKTRR